MRGASNVTTGTGKPIKNPTDMSPAQVTFGSMTIAPRIAATNIAL